jgi:hypothetical protein
VAIANEQRLEALDEMIAEGIVGISSRADFVEL